MASIFPDADAGSLTKYWLSYTGIDNGSKYILELDSMGNVVKPPILVVPVSSSIAIGSSATTILLLDGIIHIWFPGKGFPDLPIYHGRIRASTLTLLSLGKTRLLTSAANSGLQASQKKEKNFITRLVGGEPSHERGMVTAASISDSGKFTSNHWIITENTQDAAGGVSSDGRFAYYVEYQTTKARLFVQRLQKDGSPTGSPQLVDSLALKCGVGSIDSVDLTRSLSNHRRLIVYLWSPSGCEATKTAQLRVKELNYLTGEPIGNKKIIFYDHQSGKNSGITTAAIDPRGAFVVFNLHDAVAFQALDATGDKSGEKRILVPYSSGQSISGFDILRIERISDFYN